MMQKWLVSAALVMALLLGAGLACAAGADDVIYIDAVVGDTIAHEFYRDMGYTDENVGFIARRDGGDYPDWEDFVWNSWEGNPRTAFLKLTARRAGEWVFRVGVFEVPDMSKDERRLYTAEVHLRIRAASGGDAGSVGTGFVLCESLTVRRGPDAAGEAVATLSYGTMFDVLAMDGGWCEMKLGEVRGFVDARYVLRDAQFIVCEAETPVYAYPAPEAPRVALMDPEARLAIIAELEGYTVVSLRGASGFVKK